MILNTFYLGESGGMFLKPPSRLSSSVVTMEIETYCSFFVLLIVAFCVNKCTSETNVITSAPVNPVEKDGILSVRCQVWELENSHDVTLLRTINGDIQRLSLGEDILSTVGDRVFLAVRHMGDGSVVYFLSIMHVMRKDEGLYTCSVRAKSTGSQIAVSSIRMNISYFPSDSDPDCTDVPSIVQVGTLITLNCSSDEGYPRVSLTWSRAGADELKPISYVTKDNRVYASYTFKIGMNDHNSVFLCTVSSKEYPSLTQQCHVGPLKVMSISGVIPYDDLSSELTTTSDVKVHRSSPGSPGAPFEINPTFKANCDQVCAEMSSNSTFYWIVSTVVGFIFAVLFLIIVLVLIFKYLRLSNRKEPNYIAALPAPREKVYAELDSRRSDNKVYMTLEKNDNNMRQKYLFQSDIPDHYQTNPRRPSP